MISETFATWFIILTCLGGGIFFIIYALQTKFMNRSKLYDQDGQQEVEQTVQQEQEYDNDDENNGLMHGQQQQQSHSYVKKTTKTTIIHQHHSPTDILLFQNQQIINQLHDVAHVYFMRQSTFMLGFALAMWIIFYISFSADYSIFWSLVSLIYGLLSISLVTFIVLKLQINASVRFLNESLHSRGRAYAFGWGASTAIATGVICLVSFLISDLTTMTKYFLVKEDNSQDQYVGLYFVMMGFAWGVLSGALFYRQIGCEIGKGLVSGGDLIGQEHPDRIFEIITPEDEIINQGKIIGNIISQTLTNILDYVVLFTLASLIFGIILTQSEDIVALSDFSPYFFPTFAILFCLILQVLLIFVSNSKKSIEDDMSIVTPATFAAKNNVLQVILSNVLSSIVLIFVPLYFFPSEEFAIGKPENVSFYYPKVTSYSIVWCTQTGLVTQCLMVFIGELFTSNAFNLTRGVAVEQMKGSGSGSNQVHQNSSLGHGFILLVIGFSIMLCYLFAGFLGIICGLIGIMATPILLITISLFAGISHDANILAKLGKIPDHLTQNVRSMTKGALNYSIYIELTNATSVFYLDIAMIGLLGGFSNITSVEVWNPYTLFGLFIGAAIAYFLKGSSTSQIIQTARSIKNKENMEAPLDQYIDEQRHQSYYLHDNQEDIVKSNNFKEYVLSRYRVNPVLRVIVHLVGCFILMLFLAFLFGEKSVLGYIIGLNLIGMHITLYSILVHNSARNARNLNQEIQFSKHSHERNIYGLQNSIECDVASTNSETNGLLLYLVFNTLFVMMGGLQYWSTWGSFGRTLDSNRSGISEKSVSFWDIFVFGN